VGGVGWVLSGTGGGKPVDSIVVGSSSPDGAADCVWAGGCEGPGRGRGTASAGAAHIALNNTPTPAENRILPRCIAAPLKPNLP